MVTFEKILLNFVKHGTLGALKNGILGVLQLARDSYFCDIHGNFAFLLVIQLSSYESRPVGKYLNQVRAVEF